MLLKGQKIHHKEQEQETTYTQPLAVEGEEEVEDTRNFGQDITRMQKEHHEPPRDWKKWEVFQDTPPDTTEAPLPYHYGKTDLHAIPLSLYNNDCLSYRHLNDKRQS